jgi:glycosyltransferase involved in cell wall biosynthesis
MLSQSRPRLAWFSPVPPVRSGIAGRSAELVAELRGAYDIDVYVDEPVARAATAGRATERVEGCSAHEFVWRHQRQPYDLNVYQFGNSSHHDYEWPYAFRYPGLVVLHETRLHHARAAALLRTKRVADYRAEFAWNHPECNPDLAEVAVHGFDSRLYDDWPMVRALVATARLVAVHGEGAARELREILEHGNKPGGMEAAERPRPERRDGVKPAEGRPPSERDRGWGPASIEQSGRWAEAITSIRLGEGSTITEHEARAARAAVRGRHGLPGDAVVFGVFGGLIPEKRLSPILSAMPATIAHAPSAHLLLAGAPAAHYDVAAEIAVRGLTDRVTITGYLADDEELTAHLAACDVSVNLRWPSARETSGPWLRALAAGRPTIITDLVHLADVPSLDPRTWTMNGLWALDFGLWEDPGQLDLRGGVEPGIVPKPKAQSPKPDPVCVSLDIMDEDHSLRLAMRRLATDAALRARLGAAARAWWTREHAPAVMLADYRRAIENARARPAPWPPAGLPPHLRDDGDARLRTLLEPFGVTARLARDGVLR